MADISDALDTQAANTFAETLKDAGFAPWQLIVLILGGILLWNARGLYQIHVTKYQTRRKYDLLDKKADDKIRLAQAKKEARIARDASPKKMRK